MTITAEHDHQMTVPERDTSLDWAPVECETHAKDDNLGFTCKALAGLAKKNQEGEGLIPGAHTAVIFGIQNRKGLLTEETKKDMMAKFPDLAQTIDENYEVTPPKTAKRTATERSPDAPSSGQEVDVTEPPPAISPLAEDKGKKSKRKKSRK